MKVYCFEILIENLQYKRFRLLIVHCMLYKPTLVEWNQQYLFPNNNHSEFISLRWLFTKIQYIANIDKARVNHDQQTHDVTAESAGNQQIWRKRFVKIADRKQTRCKTNYCCHFLFVLRIKCGAIVVFNSMKYGAAADSFFAGTCFWAVNNGDVRFSYVPGSSNVTINLSQSLNIYLRILHVQLTRMNEWIPYMNRTVWQVYRNSSKTFSVWKNIVVGSVRL